MRGHASLEGSSARWFVAVRMMVLPAALYGCGGSVVNGVGPEGGKPDGGMDGGKDTGTDAGKPDHRAPKDATMDTRTPDTGLPEVGCGLPACPAPMITPNGGTFMGRVPIPGVTLAATGLGTGGTIYYTTDGTDPTLASLVYAAPISVVNLDTTTIMVTVRAISSDPGVCCDSSPATATFTVTTLGDSCNPPVPIPVATTQNNDFLVALIAGCAPPDGGGLAICYTL